jgi:uncharacterized membrane protein YbhN (UPF0104 family)
VTRLRAHPVLLSLLALAISAAAVVAIAAAYGFGAFGHAWSHTRASWLALALAAQLLTIPAYTLSYRAVVQAGDVPGVAPSLVARLVIAGFAPFAAGGGFALDKRALHAVHKDEEEATERVLGLGALEWAVLAPLTWVAALVLLLTHDRRPLPSVLWPWVIAVPIGFAVALWLAAPSRCSRITRGSARWRDWLGHGLRGIGMLRMLAANLPSCWTAWAGMVGYWVADIASLYGAARFIGIHISVGEIIVAYATGYALTRRSMPIAGAGATETLMTFALHWMGQPVALSLATVVVYRALSFVVSTLPALLIRLRKGPVVETRLSRRVQPTSVSE